jgi:hypothetical protein
VDIERVDKKDDSMITITSDMLHNSTPIVAKVVEAIELCEACNEYTAATFYYVGNEYDIAAININFDCGNIKCGESISHYAILLLPKAEW